MNSKIDNLARVIIRLMGYGANPYHFDDGRKKLVEALEALFENPSAEIKYPSMERTVHPASKEAQKAKEIYKDLADKEIKYNKVPDTAVNYMAAGKSFVTEFSHILTQLNHLLFYIPSDVKDSAMRDKINSLIADIEESVRLGYYIVNSKDVVNLDGLAEDSSAEKDFVETAPDGFATIQVPVGSLIVPPKMETEWAEKICNRNKAENELGLYYTPPKPTGVVIKTTHPDVLAWVDHKSVGEYVIGFTHLDGKPITADDVPLSFSVDFGSVENLTAAKSQPLTTEEEFNKEFKEAQDAQTFTDRYSSFSAEKTPTEPKFPPVMYSPDGIMWKLDKGMDADGWYNGVDEKGINRIVIYKTLVRMGFTEYKPMRSRAEILQRLNTVETQYARSEMVRGNIDVLNWVLNED